MITDEPHDDKARISQRGTSNVCGKFAFDANAENNTIINNEITINFNIGENVDLEKVKEVLNLVRTTLHLKEPEETKSRLFRR